jgi:hypothetical protein
MTRVNQPRLTPPVISLLALFWLTSVGNDPGQPAPPDPTRNFSVSTILANQRRQ